MSYKVETGQTFDAQLKRLVKKYASLKNEVVQLGNRLAENPTFGTPIGKSCYKIRLAIKSKGQGKRGNHLRRSGRGAGCPAIHLRQS